MQAVSSGLQAISGKAPRDPVAAAMVSDALRIVDSYIKVSLNHIMHTWQAQICTLRAVLQFVC